MTIHIRQISAGLQAHLDQSGTTTCFLLKIKTKEATPRVLGVTTLDVPQDYNDGSGDGTITYSAAIGVDYSSVHNTENLEVDNAEGTVLLADAGPFSLEELEAGVLDGGDYDVYLVNWQDLALGHVHVSSGVVGAVDTVEGTSATIELRGLAQILKQNFLELYSLTCRAVFGGGSYGNSRFMCGFDATTLWQSHSVQNISTEPDRVFYADSAPYVLGPNLQPLDFVPGVIEWLTGDNAGVFSEVKSVIDTTIELRFGTPWTISVADTFRIRPDCDKTWDTCKDVYLNHLNFRGEPFIPVSDAASGQTPGAQYPLYPGLVDWNEETVSKTDPAPPAPTPPTSGSFNMPSAGITHVNAYGILDSVHDGDGPKMSTTGIKAGHKVTITGSVYNDGTYLVGSLNIYSFRIKNLDGSIVYVTDEENQNLTVDWESV